MEKRVNIGMKILPTILEAVDKEAEKQSRTRSNMIEFILMDWIRKNRPELLDDPDKK